MGNKKILLCVLICYSLSATSLTSAQPSHAPVWPKPWEDAAAEHEIDPALLYAAALEASGRERDGRASPWPWTVRVGDKVTHYHSRESAQRALYESIGDGRTDIGVGLMGVEFSLVAGQRMVALDPEHNLRAGARLLRQALGQSDPGGAISRAFGGHVDGEAVLRSAATLHEKTQRTTTRNQGGPLRYASCVPENKRAVAELVERAALRHQVDPAFALGIALAESAFRQSAVSHKGARGVMQLMPATARRYGVSAYKLEQNIDGGVRYLRDLAEMFGSDPRLVAAGYNAGEGAVKKYGRQIPPFRETQAYVPRVMAARERYLRCAGAITSPRPKNANVASAR